MNAEPLLKTFTPDQLEHVVVPELPVPGDFVEFWLVGHAAGVRGRAAERLGDGWIKVRLAGIGCYAVHVSCLSIVARVQ